MTDADYADDLALLENALARIESILDSTEQAAKGIGRSVNTNRTEFMCFKQKKSNLYSKLLTSKIK